MKRDGHRDTHEILGARSYHGMKSVTAKAIETWKQKKRRIDSESMTLKELQYIRVLKT